MVWHQAMPEESLFSIKTVSSDARGLIYEFASNHEVHLNFQTIRKGYARGGHSHEYPEGFFVISGKIEYHTGKTDQEKVTVFGPGQVISTTLTEPHYVVALEDSVLVEVRPEGNSYHPVNYEPYRSIVEKLAKR